MAKHTPGPWGVDCGDLVIGGTVVAFGEHLAPETASRAEARANVLLIAAAPELLKQLKAAREFINGDSPDWRHAKQEQLAAIDAAILRATFDSLRVAVTSVGAP